MQDNIYNIYAVERVANRGAREEGGGSRGGGSRGGGSQGGGRGEGELVGHEDACEIYDHEVQLLHTRLAWSRIQKVTDDV